MCNIPKVDHVNINAHTKFSTNIWKMCNNPKLDLVNMIAYIKFDEILSIGSQDIERKQNFGVNKGPLLWYQFPKKWRVMIPS